MNVCAISCSATNRENTVSAYDSSFAIIGYSIPAKPCTTVVFSYG